MLGGPNIMYRGFWLVGLWMIIYGTANLNMSINQTYILFENLHR